MKLVITEHFLQDRSGNIIKIEILEGTKINPLLSKNPFLILKKTTIACLQNKKKIFSCSACKIKTEKSFLIFNKNKKLKKLIHSPKLCANCMTEYIGITPFPEEVKTVLVAFILKFKK